MPVDPRRTSGFLLFLAALQFTMGLMIAAALTPGYSIADNYISDLGVLEGALVFNGSLVIMGILVVGAAALWRRAKGDLLLTVSLLVVGLSAAGVGVFTEDFGIIHGIFALVVFVSGGLSAIISARATNPPLQYLVVILGIVGLVALVLFMTGTYLGLGRGGMERMIALPVLGWAMGFGGYLMASGSVAAGRP